MHAGTSYPDSPRLAVLYPLPSPVRFNSRYHHALPHSRLSLSSLPYHLYSLRRPTAHRFFPGCLSILTRTSVQSVSHSQANFKLSHTPSIPIVRSTPSRYISLFLFSRYLFLSSLFFLSLNFHLVVRILLVHLRTFAAIAMIIQYSSCLFLHVCRRFVWIADGRD